jgi:GAF domain-containing protein
MFQSDLSPHNPAYVRKALTILRDAGAQISRLEPGTALSEALFLIVQTALQLLDSLADDNANAVIYTYDAAQDNFDPDSRVSAGEGAAPLIGDRPRSNGVGATALARRSRVLSYEESTIAFHPLKYQAGIRTTACYPLLVVGQPIGALYISRYTDRPFTDDELLILDTFVQLAAVAIYNTRQFEGVNRALQRKVDELQRLQSAGQLISSRLQVDDTLHEILRTALELIRAEHGSFRLLDKKSHRLLLRAVISGEEHVPQPDQGLEVSERSGVMGWVAKHLEPACIGDLSQPPWADIYRPLLSEHQMLSELAVPLLDSGGGLEGVLNVESPHLNAFNPDDQRMLESLATQAVIAIQEAKLLSTIEEVTAHLVGHTPDEVFTLLLERVSDLLNVPYAAIWEIDSNEPHWLMARAVVAGMPSNYRVPIEGSLLGSAVASRQPVMTEQFSSDERVHRPDLVRQLNLVAALIVPLIARDGSARGAFGVYTTQPRNFSDWDTRLLACLANHAAIAVQQSQALELLKLAQERQAVAETFAVLGDIAANLLHRVNNLVGVIPVHVQGIMDKRPALANDAYVDAALHEIEDSARAAMETARETMAYLRPLRLQPISVAACYRTTLTRLNLPAHIELSAIDLDTLPRVLAGEEQLRLVLFNVIDNAIDAIGEKPGSIKVHGRVIDDPIEQTGHWVEIAIADSGPGVSAANRDKIFESDFSTKHSLKKMGFGLWWTKSLVQRCGGSIVVANTLEPGCTFIIRLPSAVSRTEMA